MTRQATLAILSGVCILLSIGLIVIPASAEGTVVYVGGSGAGNFSTIHEAIAASSPGGVIFIYPGDFHENIVVDRALELRGSGQNATTINGTGVGNVITISGDDVVIRDLTVRGSELAFPRTGIMVQANRTRVENVTSTDNFYGAILWWGTRGAVFEGDTIAANHRCGIYFSHSSDNRINWNRFMDNPLNGCGLYEGSNGNVIAGNLFARNGYCGINVRDSTGNEISGNQFENNTIALHIPPPPFKSVLLENTFQGNGQDVEEELNAFVSVGLAFAAVVFLGMLWLWRRL